jgi:hypothetical protein
MKYPPNQIVIPRVHIFTAGNWQGQTYSEADLEDMVENFRRFSSGDRPLVHVPVVIGHEEEQELLRNTGVPAVGWAVNLTREGPHLFADLSQVFPGIARLVEAGAYRHVSAEIYPPDHLPEGVPGARGCMLRRVALLGGQLPHVKSLNPLPQPMRLSEADLRPRHTPRVRLHASHRIFYPGSQTWACFSEVTAMAESALKEAAISAVKNLHPDLPDEFLGSLSDDQIAMLAAPAEPEIPPEEPSATPMQEPGAGTPVTWPDGKDRAAIEAELAALGEDPAALAAMSDEDLLALYQEKAGATPMSEGDLFDLPLEDDDVTVQTPPARQPAKVTVTKQFSERIAALEKRLKQAEAAQRRQEQLQRQQLAAQRHKTVRAFCEELSDAGKASAAEVEFGKDGKPIGPIALALSIASPVRKFGEGGASELDALMETFRKRPRRNFGEQVADPVQGGKGGPLSPERHRELLAHTRAGRNVLAREEAKRQDARVFTEQLAGLLQGKVNGQS